MTLLIDWTPALEIGHATIDDDHRQLATLLNGFGALSGTDPALAIDALTRLRDAAIAHFRREELLMHRASPEHRARHVKEHLHLADELSDRIAALRAGQSGPVETGRFIRDWMLEHVALTDRALGEALKKADATLPPDPSSREIGA